MNEYLFNANKEIELSMYMFNEAIDLFKQPKLFITIIKHLKKAFEFASIALLSQLLSPSSSFLPSKSQKFTQLLSKDNHLKLKQLIQDYEIYEKQYYQLNKILEKYNNSTIDIEKNNSLFIFDNNYNKLIINKTTISEIFRKIKQYIEKVNEHIYNIGDNIQYNIN